MKNHFFIVFLLLSIVGQTGNAQKYIYEDSSVSAEKRAEDLLKRMSLEEKVCQLQSQMVYTDFAKRDYLKGHIRNKAHFLHARLKRKATPSECAELLNEDTKKSIEASRLHIPVLQNGEALHGAQWGYATCFPQSIAMAATFSPDLYHQVGLAIAEELRAVGVRQVFAPVINISQDPRWGRTEETYGEDVLLSSQMGLAFVKALETFGVIATPKHFVDNYSDGGHDSYSSNHSWRTLREVFLEPFRVCIEEGKARSIMMAYNSVDGVPCTNNEVLINDILRKDWGFKGFIVSDYNGVNGVSKAHQVVENYKAAQAACINAGMDVDLPNGYPDLLDLVKEGKVSEQQIDSSVYRVLKCKFELGLFDKPYVDTKAANKIVRNKDHLDLSLDAARKCLTLLKNKNGTLPLSENSKIKRIGVFGPVSDFASIGGYSGPYKAEEFQYLTPYKALKERLNGQVKVVRYDEKQDISSFLKTCDVAIYFAAINEGEGGDRSQLTLPKKSVNISENSDNAIIVENSKRANINIDQEQQILEIAESGIKTVVVLQNGAYIDISRWIDKVDAVLEAWYLGEKGATAIVETLLGENNPSGHLPFTWARHSGQIPNYYYIKPSGRGYAYNDDDGKPMFPFGYGLSYTSFEYSDFKIPNELYKGDSLRVEVTIKNTGKVKGEAVPQVYLKNGITSVVQPELQLKAFQRVSLLPGESKTVILKIPYKLFGLWNQKMNFIVEPRSVSILIASDAQNVYYSSNLRIN